MILNLTALDILPSIEGVNAKDDPLSFHFTPIFVATPYRRNALLMNAKSSSAAEAILIILEAAKQFDDNHADNP